VAVPRNSLYTLYKLETHSCLSLDRICIQHFVILTCNQWAVAACILSKYLHTNFIKCIIVWYW